MASRKLALTGLLLFASLTIVAAPAAADVYVEVYSDEDGMSGVRAGADAGGCSADAYAEYMDFDGDLIPDTVPPGGRPPGSGADTTCLR